MKEFLKVLFARSNLGVLLDGHKGSDRQPDGLLVVHVDELGVASRRFPAALDPANFCKEKFQKVSTGFVRGQDYLFAICICEVLQSNFDCLLIFYKTA